MSGPLSTLDFGPVIEDAAGNGEQIADRGVAHGVADGGALLAGAHHALGPQHGELLGNRRLVEAERVLHLVDAALTAAEDLEDPDAGRVRERLEEVGLEGLRLAAPRLGAPSADAARGDRRGFDRAAAHGV